MADSHDKEIYKRPYNRPNERWVCGLAAEGRPCPHGPSQKGKCHVGYECKPERLNDRWVCTRPDQYGGPCDSPALNDPSFGPVVTKVTVKGQELETGTCCRRVQCTPSRSLRALRGRIGITLCVVLVAVILVALGGPWRNTFLSPGPLTVHHQGASMASLEDVSQASFDSAGKDSESCHICHTSLNGGLEGLLTSAFKNEPVVPQSKQCLVCHQEDVGENALFAHALSTEELALHTAEASVEPFEASKPLSLALAALSPGVQTNESGQLACAACHREHNGTFFDLKRMDSQKCQTCHVKQFKGMDNGHPEFSSNKSMAGYDYPYRRRTRLIYDHEKHANTHFQVEENKSRAPQDCTSCHEVEDTAFTTRLKSFEQICASCHTDNIVTARDKYLPVFGYPSLESDVYEMIEEDLETTIPRVVNSPMSPITALLLAGFYAKDPEEAANFASDFAMVLEYDNDLSGIAYDEDNGTAIVGRLFAGIQALEEAAKREEEGGLRGVVAAQLERLSGKPIDSETLDAMFVFPTPDGSVEKILEDVARKDIVEMAGWHVEESGYRIDDASWKATIGSVESFQALQTLAKDSGAGSYQGALDFFSDYDTFQEWFTGVVQLDDGDWISVETGKKLKSDEWETLIQAVSGGASPSEDVAESEEDAQPDAATEDAEEGADESGDETAEATTAESDAAPESSSDVDEAGEAFMAWLNDSGAVKKWLESNVEISGDRWTLRAPRSLYYRPIQHADPFTKAWLEVTASLYETNPAAAYAFDQLSGRGGSGGMGNCMKCHSIDGEKDLEGRLDLLVNWKSKQPHRDFTKFRHTPHLKLMDCNACHQGSWIEDRASFTVAKAASAEEESPVVAAEDEAASASEDAPADSEERGEGAPAEEAAKPDISYAESFQVRDNSREMSVDFANTHQSDEHTFVSNFQPIAKDMCAKCHVASKAGDNCLICHNYHIEPQSRSLGVQSLKAFIKGPEVASAE